MVSSNINLKDTEIIVMIIELGKASVETKSTIPNGLLQDSAGKAFPNQWNGNPVTA